MQAIIFKPVKSSMQSGNHQRKDWMIKFQHDGSRAIEPVMGWTSSCNTMQEVQLTFNNKEEAIAFAEKNDISYEVIGAHEKKQVIRPYADNFK